MNKKVLIADQSEAVRGVAENVLRRNGIEVISANDGLEAADLIRSAEIDLAFLNSALPDLDGYSLSRQIKSDIRTKKVKVVLLLSTSEIVNQRQLMSSQADDTLNKPFSQQDLLEKCGSLLGLELGEKTPEKKEGDELKEEVEELKLGENVDEEIDFGSIFESDKRAGAGEDLDGVFLDVEERSDRSVASDNSADAETKDPEIENFDEEEDGIDSPIRIVDDQFGMEHPLPESEIQRPHDYNWFIREMKKELSGDKQPEPSASALSPSTATKATPGVPKKSSSTPMPKGSFAVEELGSSKIDLSVVPKSAESAPRQERPKEGRAQAPVEEGELSLAEKVLIKEVSRQIAEKIAERLSTSDLRSIVREILQNLRNL